MKSHMIYLCGCLISYIPFFPRIKEVLDGSDDSNLKCLLSTTEISDSNLRRKREIRGELIKLLKSRTIYLLRETVRKILRIGSKKNRTIINGKKRKKEEHGLEKKG